MEKQILSEMQYLPENLKMEIFHFVSFLKHEYLQQNKSVKNNQRVFGRSKGRYQISADFNAPLEDFNDYM
jgi:Protein of unknown function (DUF2281)